MNGNGFLTIGEISFGIYCTSQNENGKISLNYRHSEKMSLSSRPISFYSQFCITKISSMQEYAKDNNRPQSTRDKGFNNTNTSADGLVS